MNFEILERKNLKSAQKRMCPVDRGKTFKKKKIEKVKSEPKSGNENYEANFPEYITEDFPLYEWQDNMNVWKTFDPVTQQILMLADFLESIQVMCNGTNYTIDFQRMIQINNKTKTERLIRRRTRIEIKNQKKSNTIVKWEWSMDNSAVKWTSYALEPTQYIENAFLNMFRGLHLNFRLSDTTRKYYINLIGFSQTNISSTTQRFIRRIEWNEEIVNIPYPLTVSQEIQTILLQPNCDEFKAIEQYLNFTGFSKQKIQNIERVENFLLLESYRLHKQLISNRMNGIQPEERFLFHGTKASNIQTIIKHGFDLRYNTRFMYGKGNYFAAMSSMAHLYTCADDAGNRQILLCKVLIGQSIIYKENMGPLTCDSIYDSVKDQEIPTIYVTTERSQSYPAYIITYRERSLSIGN